MSRRTWGLLILAIAAAGLFSIFASTNPDGLERVLEDLHVSVPATEAGTAPLPDYQVPAVQHQALSGSLAGLIGVMLTLGAAWAAFRLLSAPDRKGSAEG